MAIKNKDGSVYKLTSPNPVRKEQKQWNDTPMVLHNFDWQGLTLPDETAPATSFSSDIKQLNVSSVMEPPVKPVVVEPTPVETRTPVEPEPVEVKEPEPANEIEEIKKEIAIVVQETGTQPTEMEMPTYSSETQKFLNDQKLLMWCSPPVITEHIDHLYGENQRSVTYTTKFSFEGVIISQNDLQMKFWAPVKLTRNSIVFPRDTKTRKSRWWRITEIENKDGTIATCIPSDQSLNFSD